MTATTAVCMIRGGWMILVTDTSVAVKWAIPEADSDLAEQLLDDSHELYVPRLLASELGNALWSKVRSAELTPEEVPPRLESVLARSLHWEDDETLVADALDIALALNHPIYDCTYLALAHQIDGTLVTADARFVNTLAGTEHAGRVVLLADFAAA